MSVNVNEWLLCASEKEFELKAVELIKNLDLFDEDRIKNILKNADIVINLCGILFENKNQKLLQIYDRHQEVKLRLKKSAYK